MRKNIVRAIALLCLASITLAYDRQISWVPPTFYTNGEPLLEQDLDFYTVYCDGAQLVVIDSIIGTVTATVDLPSSEGTHVCHMTVTTLTGVESDPSNELVFTNQLRAPAAPVVMW